MSSGFDRDRDDDRPTQGTGGSEHGSDRAAHSGSSSADSSGDGTQDWFWAHHGQGAAPRGADDQTISYGGERVDAHGDARGDDRTQQPYWNGDGYGSGSPSSTGYYGTPSYPGQSYEQPQEQTRQLGYGNGPSQANGGYPGAAGPATQTMPAPAVGRRTGGKRRGRAGLFVVGMAFAALVGAGAGVGSYAYVSRDAVSSASPIAVNTAPAPQSPTLNGTVEAAAAKIQPSVVTITVQNGSSGDIGTGVVLDKQGHILTNNHVVSTQSAQGYGQGSTSNTKITVTFSDGKTATATVVGTAATEDLAVIKVDGVGSLTPATFADSSSLKVGQSVVAAGAPLGLSQTITSGIVSSTARPVRSGDNNDAVYMAVQTDAAINPGNSGGPLVDLNGSVVGINSSIASTGSSSEGAQSGNIGIGFAIPSDVATRVAGQLISSGQASDAALGVTVSNNDTASLGSTSTGVSLATVRAGGAAAKAGLQAGDVVTKVNDFETTTADGLIAATRYYAPGTQVKVTYTRNGQPQTVSVTLGSL